MTCSCLFCGVILAGPEPSAIAAASAAASDSPASDTLTKAHLAAYAALLHQTGVHMAQAHPAQVRELNKAGRELASYLAANLISLRVLDNYQSSDPEWRERLEGERAKLVAFVDGQMAAQGAPGAPLVTPAT